MIKGKSRSWIQITIAVVLIGLAAIMFFSTPKSHFDKVSFNDNNIVINRAHKNYLDTIVRAGLQSIQIDNVNVLLLPLKKQSIGDYELKGAIVKIKSGYVISIINTNRAESIEIIAHELVHLEQYNSKTVVLFKDGITYYNIFYPFRYFPLYEKRLWEIEAFLKQSIVKKDIESILYN